MRLGGHPLLSAGVMVVVCPGGHPLFSAGVMVVVPLVLSGGYVKDIERESKMR